MLCETLISHVPKDGAFAEKTCTGNYFWDLGHPTAVLFDE
jgi:hypothetical protein